MEDPWGSPWATADAASPPKIDLPAAPPSAHFPIENANTTAALAPPASSPRRSIQSPWEEEDDAWGGWNDGTAAGANSPGWGRSPGLRPVAPSLSSSRGVSPDPWRLGSDDRRRSSSVNKRSPSRAGSDAVGDSAISLSHAATPSLNPKPSSLAGLESQNAWLSPQPASEAEKPVTLALEVPEASPELLKVASPDGGLEDDGARSPNSTKSSSKVQELVDMYDGIAEQSVSPIETQFIKPPLRKVSSKGQSLEDVSAASEQAVIEQVPEVQEPPQDIASPASEPAEHEEPVGEVKAQSPPVTSTVPETIQQKPNHSAIKIPVDLAKLDELFPSSPAVNVESELVPDVIIDDTFSSISERKAWYRLSRQGSMRMHNLGDDENYVRMDWSRSTLRQDTLKIVRRWMEEDSITGRPVLGRKTGVIGASMFNWDSSAPAVQIGELLGRKSGHSRQTSSSSKLSLSSPRVASFEWASPPSSPTSSMAPPSLAGRLKHTETRSNRPQSLAGPPTTTKDSLRPSSFDKMQTDRPKSLIVPPPDPVVQPSIDQALSQPEEPTKADYVGENTILNGKDDNNDEDDDWGEMISSPNLQTIPMAGNSASKPELEDKTAAKQPEISNSAAVTSSKFERQELHGTPDNTSTTTGTNVASTHKRVTSDPWSLDELDNWSDERQQQNTTNRLPEKPADPGGVIPTAVAPKQKELGKATSPQSASFAWSTEPLEALHPAPATEANAKAKAKAPTKASLDTSPVGPRPPQSITSPLASSEGVDDETVAHILRGIPDLSYMLR